ncbi:unnamed protein product [Brassicogethes aeneus]|uniref:Transient receptor ion channel domain-containing protein n=1 Tax=Brassicogethes aeneus TaxID=1431903 RepID=A0A9P0FJX8_BRAAE|nr:unnamed protein product [Brassicogethes aeneus]
MLQRAEETGYININCVDPLGRSALLMAIDNENLEMVELLIEHKVETKDALLHAISEEFVEASWEALPPDTATFTPDITPLILSAHRDNYEIIKILLDRGATLPMPHDVRCGCDECVTSRFEDSLRHSRSRINAYRALASPSLIALSSKDPILTAFELSWELRRLSFMEHEFKSEYQELRKQCQDFATALLDHTRSSYELEVLLNHDPTGPAFEHGDRMHLNRLKLAIKLRQKKTLFWAVFGLIDLESFELHEIKIFTRFWGMLMFGTYSVINIVVLLNLLIAMMNHSYQLISERADTEWKFARSKLWISYFEEGGTVPPPFNVIPTPKTLWYILQWFRRKFCGQSRAAKKEHMRTIRYYFQKKVKQASERDFRYQSIMRNLVRRYVTVEQRKAENQGVTEDDVNEIKQDISAFRFELIEILKNSGMNVLTAHSGLGTGGKKNRQKERRLMKGFNIGPQPSQSTGSLPPVAEFIASLQHQEGNHHDFFGSTLSGIFNSTPRRLHQHSSTVSSSQGSINESGNHHHHSHHHHHHKGLSKFHIKRTHSHKRRWGTLIEAAKTGKVSRLIGRSRSEDSVCNNCQRENGRHAHAHSPQSDECSASRSDSNPSLDTPEPAPAPEPELHGLAQGLALLKRKRKKFSASRNASPGLPGAQQPEGGSAKSKAVNKKLPQVLKRASSVPTRVPEVAPVPSHHERPSKKPPDASATRATPGNRRTLTPSTTEESVVAVEINHLPSGSSSKEPLLYNSSSSTNQNGSQTPEDEKEVPGSAGTSYELPKLPGIIPLTGHNGPSGWL